MNRRRAARALALAAATAAGALEVALSAETLTDGHGPQCIKLPLTGAFRGSTVSIYARPGRREPGSGRRARASGFRFFSLASISYLNCATTQHHDNCRYSINYTPTTVRC